MGECFKLNFNANALIVNSGKSGCVCVCERAKMCNKNTFTPFVCSSSSRKKIICKEFISIKSWFYSALKARVKEPKHPQLFHFSFVETTRA